MIKFLTGFAIVSGAACGGSPSSTGGIPETPGLVVVNAPATGKVKRILVWENMDVAENTVLIEIDAASNNAGQRADSNRPAIDAPAQDQGTQIAAADEEVQRAAVEVQRLEPLVASGGAPQSHLDAARAEYQKAQERIDELRRRTPDPALPLTADKSSGQTSSSSSSSSPAENLFAVRSPVTGNVRVISVRIGQSVKAGEPLATISKTGFQR